MKLTNELGVILGVMIVLALVLLVWVITRKVMDAIARTDQLKESFLTTISHELRTPINGVVGSLSLLKRTPMAQQQGELLDMAILSSKTMVQSVDDILTFAELMAGQAVLSLTLFDASKALEDLHAWAITMAEDKKLALQWQVDAQRYWVRTDQGKLLNLIRHLIDNAIRYSEQGQVSFGLSIREIPGHQADTSGLLQLQIVDTGPGIAPPLLEEIFKPFQQLDGSFSRTHQGLGIGLAMSRSIAVALKGTLTIENNQGGPGVTARFTCPVGLTCIDNAESQSQTGFSKQTAISVPSASSAPSAISTEPAFSEQPVPVAESAKPRQPRPGEFLTEKGIRETPASQQKHPLVLIAEDNKVNQIVLNKLVKQLHFDTVLAANGSEALQLVQTHPVDLVLMDCQMPVLDGLDATRAIRTLRGEKSAIPIIAVTANARDLDRERCMAAGMNGFLGKPVDYEIVRKTLHAYLGRVE
jgi:CheY-like chemotaxis protein/nitrogen-specific signal transduction histidine kinase